MSHTGLPFDDIRTLLGMLPPPDAEAMARVTARNQLLAKPEGALGQLEPLAVWLAGWQGNPRPQITRPLLAIFAGTHGIAASGRLGMPDETADEVTNLAAGGAAANQICAIADVGLKVFELALPIPTGAIDQRDAFDERDCAATIAFGMEAIAGGADLMCVGAVGTGGVVSAAALLTAIKGGRPQDWLALAPPVMGHASQIVDAALARHSNAAGDPLEALRRLGGRECAAMVGAILAARLQRIPVLLSGIVSLAAAAVLDGMGVGALDHCRAAHSAPHAAHDRALAALDLSPILSTEFSQDDGAGAALAVPHLRAAASTANEMAQRQPAAPAMLLN